MIRDFCTALVIISIIFGGLFTVDIAFSSRLMCRNSIAPIDYIVPVRVVGCWLGGKPMQSREQNGLQHD